MNKRNELIRMAMHDPSSVADVVQMLLDSLRVIARDCGHLFPGPQAAQAVRDAEDKIY